MDKELVCQYCHKNPKEEGSNYCVDCHARIRLHNKEWYHTHKEYAKERVRKWRESHKEEGLRKVRDYRRTLKIKIIETMGGKCMHCGYDKNYAVLSIHHKNPQEKEGTKDWRNKNIFKNLEKYELLCSNCHLEYHHPYSNKV